MKIDNNPGSKKMSKLGTEAQLLSQLMAQSQWAKKTVADSSVSVPDQSADRAGSEGTADEQPLRTRASKRKATEDVATLPPVTAVPIAQVVTSTGLRVGEHVEAASKRTRVVLSVARASASGKLKAIAGEMRLEDNGFVHLVAERLKSGGLDRMVQL